MQNELTPLIEQLVRLFNKFHQIETRPRRYGTPVLIYFSEIHVLDVAGRYPGASLSEIADRLGVTRGAVWQTVKKLEAKHLVTRACQPGSAKEVTLNLTDTGWQAFNAFQQVLTRKDASISVSLEGLTAPERARVKQWMDQLESFMDKINEEEDHE
ncbi:MAG TPA: MarR family transcriptional regulator [Anaerolineaceae bacterium]|nr:MarR family transcriptional regulator [Anaerolineaceae bacterium]HPN53766.1 MarR family transcriptional regulator [Anaerolineaceae bacterium]